MNNEIFKNSNYIKGKMKSPIKLNFKFLKISQTQQTSNPILTVEGKNHFKVTITCETFPS